MAIKRAFSTGIDCQKFRGDRNRIGFFAEGLNHSNQLICEQANLEVGRAPYASIKRIASTLPRQQIRKLLDRRRLVEWHGLYILMLGQSRSSDDIAYIRNQFESDAAYGLQTNLSVWLQHLLKPIRKLGWRKSKTCISATRIDNRMSSRKYLKD